MAKHSVLPTIAPAVPTSCLQTRRRRRYRDMALGPLALVWGECGEAPGYKRKGPLRVWGGLFFCARGRAKVHFRTGRGGRVDRGRPGERAAGKAQRIQRQSMSISETNIREKCPVLLAPSSPGERRGNSGGIPPLASRSPAVAAHVAHLRRRGLAVGCRFPPEQYGLAVRWHRPTPPACHRPTRQGSTTAGKGRWFAGWRGLVPPARPLGLWCAGTPRLRARPASSAPCIRP